MTELDALEAVFAAEMEGAPLYVTRVPSKLRRKLVEKGELEHVTHTFNGRPRVTCQCIALTHKGRIRYCEWAAKNAPEAA